MGDRTVMIIFSPPQSIEKYSDCDGKKLDQAVNMSVCWLNLLSTFFILPENPVVSLYVSSALSVSSKTSSHEW